MDAMALPVDVREIYRYLGYRGNPPTAEVAERVDSCLLQLRKASTPAAAHRFLPLASPEENVLLAGEIKIHSKNLYKNMKGCSACCLFAATIGIGCDRLIRRAQLTSMADAAILQAAGAALIESLCDEINRQVIEEAKAKGLFARPRFSPGYGDFSIQHQKDFEQVLQMAKNCGIHLTDSLLMMPSKSVTAIIGLSATDTPCILQGCETCDHAPNCAFRR
jgi:hypothetical protein